MFKMSYAQQLAQLLNLPPQDTRFYNKGNGIWVLEFPRTNIHFGTKAQLDLQKQNGGVGGYVIPGIDKAPDEEAAFQLAKSYFQRSQA
jgi:hypothetical protein